MSLCYLLVLNSLSVLLAPCGGQDMRVADSQVLAVGPKCDVCPISRVMCLELYEPKGRYGFMPMFFL